MKTFKDVWEDAAANSVSGGGVEMPADVQQDKKRRKKAVYDGRTKEGRKFVERMMARRKAKEDKEKKKLHAQNMKSVEVKEEQLEEAKLKFYGSEISGLRDTKGGMFTAKAVEYKGKLAYRVVNQFGDIETIDLKAFSRRFG